MDEWRSEIKVQKMKYNIEQQPPSRHCMIVEAQNTRRRIVFDVRCCEAIVWPFCFVSLFYILLLVVIVFISLPYNIIVI